MIQPSALRKKSFYLYLAWLSKANHFCSITNSARFIAEIAFPLSRVFSELPEDAKPIPRKNLKEKFLNELPVEFNRQTFQEIARKLGINTNSADRYMNSFMEKAFIHRDMRNSYRKNKD